MKKTGKHPQLKILWHETETGIKFQDGVEYNHSELKILKPNPPDDYNYLHLVKSVFESSEVVR